MHLTRTNSAHICKWFERTKRNTLTSLEWNFTPSQRQSKTQSAKSGLAKGIYFHTNSTRLKATLKRKTTTSPLRRFFSTIYICISSFNFFVVPFRFIFILNSETHHFGYPLPPPKPQNAGQIYICCAAAAVDDQRFCLCILMAYVGRRARHSPMVAYTHGKRYGRTYAHFVKIGTVQMCRVFMPHMERKCCVSLWQPLPYAAVPLTRWLSWLMRAMWIPLWQWGGLYSAYSLCLMQSAKFT